jgi:3-hydroxybutyryl-CoA dehydratase
MTIATHIKVGEQAEYTRTISEADILGFAEISGDHAPIHVDEAYARTTAYGRRIAHGALMMGLLSATSTVISERSTKRGATHVPVSLGYDRIRIIRPVFIDDTVTARYTVEDVDEEQGRTRSKVEIVNQAGELCLVGTHVLKWVAPR